VRETVSYVVVDTSERRTERDLSLLALFCVCTKTFSPLSISSQLPTFSETSICWAQGSKINRERMWRR
jgi:hypothetical protein